MAETPARGLRERCEALRPLLERLRVDTWFPHVPLAMALAPLALRFIHTASRASLGVSLLSGSAGEAAENLASIDLTSTPELSIGVLLLAMSVGILLRSRFAWFLSVVGLILALVLHAALGGRPGGGLEVIYAVLLLAALVASRRHFRQRSLLISATFALFALLALFAYATLATLQMGERFDPPVRDLTTALYFAVVTIASVGYGDIVPRDSQTRLFVTGMIVIGLSVGATAISAVFVPLVSGRLRALLGTQEELVNRSKHFVIVGPSPLARNCAEELEKRGRRVTFILPRANEQPFYQKRDVVLGDPSDLSVLREAGTEQARAVLALSTDDAENGFVVLGVNELAPAISSVAALNDPSNRSRLMRTQPSLLLSLQVLGGQLLAMALTGERVDTEDLLERVLQLHPGPGSSDEKAGSA